VGARGNKLGEYLKARRAQISPERAGVPLVGSRRVPGLRREEVADLAGLSVDYYTRLEQGRERHPSASTLNALARTLELGPDAQRYLFAIAAPRPKLPQPRTGEVGTNLAELLEQWNELPATVTDQVFDVVAANHLSWAVYGGHRHTGNHARLVFLDPDRKAYFREWDKVASGTVAQLRAAATLDPENVWMANLVGELTAQSPEFKRLWAKADVRERTSSTFLITHPEVGDLDLLYETFRPNSNPNLLLTVHWPIAGSGTADKLKVLGGVHARRKHADDQTAAASAGDMTSGALDPVAAPVPVRRSRPSPGWRPSFPPRDSTS
jgi:transcriptional regulator with XRE-family HTH domain